MVDPSARGHIWIQQWLYPFSAIIEIAIGSQLLNMGDDAEASGSGLSEGHNVGQEDE